MRAWSRRCRSLQQTAVGHLVRQGVLEGVVALREQAGFVEELGGLQVRQAPVQRLLGLLGNGLQQRPGHLRANDRGGLEQALLLRGSRSMRAASTACTVAGTCRPSSGLASR